MLVAVTVDVEDGDHGVSRGADAVTEILHALGSQGLRATFFLQGRWVEVNPESAASIRTAGHLIGNHSYYHIDSRLLTGAGMRADVRKSQGVIQSAVGIDPRPWYRLPFGAGAQTSAIGRRLGSLGYRHVGWDIDVRDFELSHPADVVDVVARGLRARDEAGETYAIILLHSWPVVTATAMPDLCRLLRSRSDRIVTVDELPSHAYVTRSASYERAQRIASWVRGARNRRPTL